MTEVPPYGGVRPTTRVDRLLLPVEQLGGPKLIAIDPASRFRGGNQDAADDATRLVEQVERIAQRTGATVLVAHHVNKAALQAQRQSQVAIRGSSALADGVRWQMNLARPPDDVATKFGICEPDWDRVLIGQLREGVAWGRYSDSPPSPRMERGILVIMWAGFGWVEHARYGFTDVV